MNDLKDLFSLNFQPHNIMVTLESQIRAESKKFKDENLDNKAALNMVYYKLRMLFIKKHNNVPPYSINLLLKDYKESDPWIGTLLELRKNDKRQIFERSKFPKFEEFVTTSKDQKKINVQVDEKNRKEAEDMFFKHCGLMMVKNL